MLVDRDALLEINKKNFSQVLSAINEIEPKEVEKMMKELGTQPTEYEFREPRWIKIIKKEQTIDSTDVQNFVKTITKKHQNKIQVYKKSLHKKLWDFAEKRNIYAIKEGAIEDLMDSVDSNLYRKLKIENRSKRIRARKFVEQLESSKLNKLEIPIIVLEKAVNQVD